MTYYGQNQEDKVICDYFTGNIGKFVDIGSYEVFKFSNVRKLYELGWSGVMVEPAPKNYKAIAEHYKEEKRIEVLNIAVGETRGEVYFYDSNGDAVGTTDENHMKKWKQGGVAYFKITVSQIGVDEFMNTWGKDVDFLNIDTEATNMTIFRLIPDWVLDRVQMICIEHDGFQEEIKERLKPFGFTERLFNAENLIMAK